MSGRIRLLAGGKMTKLGGKDVATDSEGYLINENDWTKSIAKDIAKDLKIALTDKHWQVLEWLRRQHKDGVELTIRRVGKSGVTDIKEFYNLFPGGPLKNASKVAGLKRPTSCI